MTQNKTLTDNDAFEKLNNVIKYHQNIVDVQTAYAKKHYSMTGFGYEVDQANKKASIHKRYVEDLQAAKQETAKEIERLSEKVEHYDRWLSGGVYYTNEEACKLHNDYKKTITELQSQVNMLRPALVFYTGFIESRVSDPANKALSTTAKQSLIEHDNSTIAKVTGICSVITQQITGNGIDFDNFEAIRALKVTT